METNDCLVPVLLGMFRMFPTERVMGLLSMRQARIFWDGLTYERQVVDSARLLAFLCSLHPAATLQDIPIDAGLVPNVQQLLGCWWAE